VKTSANGATGQPTILWRSLEQERKTRTPPKVLLPDFAKGSYLLVEDSVRHYPHGHRNPANGIPNDRVILRHGDPLDFQWNTFKPVLQK
jgi:hypothetical protein